MMKKIKLMLAAAVAVFMAAGVSAQTLSEVNAKYKQATELIGQKDYINAITVLEQTIDMGFDAGDEAMLTVQNAQGLIPNCYFQTALALCKANKFDQAIPYIDNAAETGELYGKPAVVRNAKQLKSKAYYAMGANAFNEEDYAKAIEDFSKGYDANPNDTKLALALAESYAKFGNLNRAIEIYNDVISLESRHSNYKPAADEARAKQTSYLMEEAAKQAKAGKTREVYQAVERILEIDPTNATAQLLRLQTANNAKDYQAVIRWGESTAQAQAAAESKSDVYYLLGAAYQNTDNTAKAIEVYKKVTAGKNVAGAQAQIAALTKKA